MSARTLEPQFSRRVRDLHASPIREILSVIGMPDMVSFAGGLPAQDSFPVLSLEGMPPGVLQYGATEGDAALREQIAADMVAAGLHCSAAQVVVLSGSQQGIDLVAKLFVDQGTPVAVEIPTYLAALQVLRFFGARFSGLNAGEPDLGWSQDLRPALAYAIPTFQNPTGYCYAPRERERLASTCDARGVTLFEDDPYRDLVYDACERTPVCAQLERASWIYQGSFSKSLAPGLRLGFLVASPDLIGPLSHLKQATDLHSNRVSQWLVLQELQSPARKPRLAQLVAGYRARRDRFATALERHLGGLATWETPPGGLFFWLNLQEARDTRELLPDAIRQGVAFMPGEPFFADGRAHCGALRLNFSHAQDSQVERGLVTLAGLLR